jgi:phenylpropionate dioxygenase-like ring-hydroxylating dioxygenase large terminal subunit
MAHSNVREIVKDVPEGLELGLRNYWYPILLEEELPADKPVGLMALGEKLVAWRDRSGTPHVLRDHCAHRGAKLSVGEILDDDIQCVFHGLRYNGSGRCVLIPWEPDDSPLRDEVSVQSYPAQALGGYIWAYLGDAEAFPPPPLEDEVPEELLDEAHFIWFHLPAETWTGNWLVTLDGQDAYHPVILHSRSQAVAGGKLDGSSLPMIDRRIRFTEASYGMRAFATDRNGTPVNQGHFTEVKGDRFCLPCLSTNPLRPTGEKLSYVSRVWQMPIDRDHTRAMRFVSFRAETDAERDACSNFYDEIALPRSLKVSAEDAFISEAQGTLEEARNGEFLFAPDEDTLRLRRLLKQVFLDQYDGKRTAVTKEAMQFPI